LVSPIVVPEPVNRRFNWGISLLTIMRPALARFAGSSTRVQVGLGVDDVLGGDADASALLPGSPKPGEMERSSACLSQSQDAVIVKSILRSGCQMVTATAAICPTLLIRGRKSTRD